MFHHHTMIQVHGRVYVYVKEFLVGFLQVPRTRFKQYTHVHIYRSSLGTHVHNVHLHQQSLVTTHMYTSNSNPLSLHTCTHTLVIPCHYPHVHTHLQPLVTTHMYTPTCNPLSLHTCTHPLATPCHYTQTCNPLSLHTPAPLATPCHYTHVHTHL